MASKSGLSRQNDSGRSPARAVPIEAAKVRNEVFATGPGQQQVRQCPLCRRKRKEVQSISGTATGALKCSGIVASFV